MRRTIALIFLLYNGTTFIFSNLKLRSKPYVRKNNSERSYKKGHKGGEEGPLFYDTWDMKFTRGFYEVMAILRPRLAFAISYNY